MIFLRTEDSWESSKVRRISIFKEFEVIFNYVDDEFATCYTLKIISEDNLILIIWWNNCSLL